MASKRDKIKLQSTESTHFYTTTKNKRKTVEKLQLMKYDPIVKRHVLYKEDRLK